MRNGIEVRERTKYELDPALLESEECTQQQAIGIGGMVAGHPTTNYQHVT